MRYYVYALIDPTNGNQPFYIGKGLDNRMQSHFKESTAYYESENDISIVGCDTNSIMEYAKEVPKALASASPKLQKINELCKQGFDHTHVHLILRYVGDISDFRGGVRNLKKALVEYDG